MGDEVKNCQYMAIYREAYTMSNLELVCENHGTDKNKNTCGTIFVK